MPKARPLPTDPKERARIIKQRADTVKRVEKWRKAHPEQKRILTRYTVGLHLQRVKMRQLYRQAA